MILFGDVYRNRRVLVTGHTGFKGSWLAFWLNQLGAKVAGISLDPRTKPNHWGLLEFECEDCRLDIRQAEKVNKVVASFQPEIVFHLAAQPLVRSSYRDPLDTWSSNVMGTANLLDVCRRVKSVKAIVVVTTDKVYSNQEWPWGYRENDRLGGHDPYSASKAACELLVDSYRNAFFSREGALSLASARAGNVVGGGDWSEDRLIPDLVKSIGQGKPLVIRSPKATRPWQHVLECLSGYLLLGQKLFQHGDGYGQSWNFGPPLEGNRSVEEILTLLQAEWPDLKWRQTSEEQPHEATLLYLDCAKARAGLGWQPVWGLEQALKYTADWYRQHQEQNVVLTECQLSNYINDSCSLGVNWIINED